jgi:hypothetical protein
MYLFAECLEPLHRFIMYLMLSFEDKVVAFEGLLELEGEASTDVLDHTWRPSFFQFLYVCHVLMTDFIDEEYDTTTCPGRFLTEKHCLFGQ